MKQKTYPLILIPVLFLSILFSCKKKEEQKKTIPLVSWTSPLLDKEYTKGASINVSIWCTFTSNINSISVSLISPESDLNIELNTTQINGLAAKINFTFILDSAISESHLQLNAKIISDAGTNNFKRTLKVTIDSSLASFEFVKIIKNEYGKFDIQKLTSTLSPVNNPNTFNYEFESAISINKSLFISTKQGGGLIKINPNMEQTVLLENKYSTVPFIHSMAVFGSKIYAAISTPSNQIIGFNSNGNETVRAGLQLDVSEEILLVDDLIYSIERPTNGGSFIIVNYNQRTGGYISSQNVTRLTEDPHLFDFGNKKQVYFYYNVSGKVQIERLSQNENNISIIEEISGTCLDQKPLEISEYEVVIPLKNQLLLFNKDHISGKLFSSNEEIKTVRLNSSKDRLVVLTDASITLFNYPSFKEISKTSSIANIIDIQFID